MTGDAPWPLAQALGAALLVNRQDPADGDYINVTEALLAIARAGEKIAVELGAIAYAQANDRRPTP